MSKNGVLVANPYLLCNRFAFGMLIEIAAWQGFDQGFKLLGLFTCVDGVGA
jgi:hypothetical protein